MYIDTYGISAYIPVRYRIIHMNTRMHRVNLELWAPYRRYTSTVPVSLKFVFPTRDHTGVSWPLIFVMKRLWVKCCTRGRLRYAIAGQKESFKKIPSWSLLYWWFSSPRTFVSLPRPPPRKRMYGPRLCRRRENDHHSRRSAARISHFLHRSRGMCPVDLLWCLLPCWETVLIDGRWWLT